MTSLSSTMLTQWKKAATAGLALASLGAVTLATVEPAHAFRGGGVGFRHFGGGVGHGFGGFRGGYGFRGGIGRFGYGGGWGGRRFGWGGYGYRRFGWGYPALGFGLGYGLASASYGYGYPYGGYGGYDGYTNAGYAGEGYGGGAYDEGDGSGVEQGSRRRYRHRYDRHGVCDPYGVQTHLSKRYC